MALIYPEKLKTWIAVCSLSIIAADGFGLESLNTTISNGNLEVALEPASGMGHLVWMEWSEDMENWEPVARDYGFSWESGFPHNISILGAANSQTLSHPVAPQARFFRAQDVVIPRLGNEHLISRFLQQSTFGPTRDLISTFPGIDAVSGFNDYPYAYFAQWIDAQMSLPVTSLRAFWRERSNPAFTDNTANSPFEVAYDPALGTQMTYWTYAEVNGKTETVYVEPVAIDANNDGYIDPEDARKVNDISFARSETKQIVWYQAAVTAPDVLRQRTAWALSQIFVLGEQGSVQADAAERWLVYYDIFLRNAFGNFRDILGEVTFNPIMGDYLTYIDNRKADGFGTFPDENYAREVMQLFTIGLWMLNQDGTRILDATGNALPSYDNDDIFEFAKIFTGLRKQLTTRGGIGSLENIETKFNSNFIDPLRMQITWHDTTAKTLLNGSILGPYPATEEDGIDEINAFLDHLFHHQNTPPFISRRLIQRLTVSNPSPNYINDVAQAFIVGTHEGVGTGVRGDLTAVFRAILLHPEAREPALSADSAHGKLREPLIRLLHYARAFEITSSQHFGLLPFWQLDQVIAQSPFDYPSVFNFYLPDFQPQGVILDRGLTSPEFEITTDVTSLGLVNAIRNLVHNGIINPSGQGVAGGSIGTRWYSQGDLDLTHEIALASTSNEDLLDHLDTLLTAGRLTPGSRTILLTALTHPDTDPDPEARVKLALSLFSLLPEFNVIY